MSSLSKEVISQPMRRMSTAILKSREYVCFTDVMKPWGKKKPEGGAGARGRGVCEGIWVGGGLTRERVSR